MKKFGTFGVIILLANISFLFSPREFPEKARHTWGDFYIGLNEFMGIRVNGDAFAFVALAINPNHLLDSQQVRQSRPGYIIAANLVGSVIYAATYPFRDRLENFFQGRISTQFPQKEKDKIARWFSFYSAYLLLNLLVLVISMCLFDQLVISLTGPWKSVAIRNLLVFLLTSNPVMKLFFWSPHVQVFNILTPLLMIGTCLYLKKYAGNTKRLYLVSLVSGCLLLCYGSFLLLGPALVFGYWYNLQFQAKKWSLQRSLRAISLLLVFALPVLAWMAFVYRQTGSFYSAEIAEYRQFVWIADAWQQSATTFFSSLLTNSISFLQTMPALIWSVFFLFIALFYHRQKQTREIFPSQAAYIILNCGITLIVFLWMMGYYADRLTLSIASPVFLFTAILFNRSLINRNKIIFLYTIALIAHILLILGNPTGFGPYYYN